MKGKFILALAALNMLLFSPAKAYEEYDEEDEETETVYETAYETITVEVPRTAVIYISESPAIYEGDEIVYLPLEAFSDGKDMVDYLNNDQEEEEISFNLGDLLNDQKIMVPNPSEEMITPNPELLEEDQPVEEDVDYAVNPEIIEEFLEHANSITEPENVEVNTGEAEIEIPDPVEENPEEESEVIDPLEINEAVPEIRDDDEEEEEQGEEDLTTTARTIVYTKILPSSSANDGFTISTSETIPTPLIEEDEEVELSSISQEEEPTNITEGYIEEENEFNSEEDEEESTATPNEDEEEEEESTATSNEDEEEEEEESTATSNEDEEEEEEEEEESTATSNEDEEEEEEESATTENEDEEEEEEPTTENEEDDDEETTTSYENELIDYKDEADESNTTEEVNNEAEGERGEKTTAKSKKCSLVKIKQCKTKTVNQRKQRQKMKQRQQRKNKLRHMYL